MNADEPIDPESSPASEEAFPAGAERELWSPPTAEELQQMLPQFEVLELIGLGGMGAVYKAKQRSLDRLVAIKILPPGALDGDNTEFVERFKNEARLMARMNHPDIVTVHDFGETVAGHLYFIMEFVDGTDVSKMIESQGRLQPEHALAITAHVCDALQYAHKHGVIHRDIKPGNVLINNDGEVKVADFGIAKVGGGHKDGLVEENTTLGTPEFIAPEALIVDVEVDHRADLYSIGVMLYVMLTGQTPKGEYQPASQLAGCDARYDAIIARALQPDRDHRYQSALEIRRDLDHIIITPVVKEGEKVAKAAIPRQFVNRPVSNAPVYQRPGAVRYAAPPVPKNNGLLMWGLAAAAVVGIGFFIRQKNLGNKPDSLEGGEQSKVTPPQVVDGNSSNNSSHVPPVLPVGTNPGVQDPPPVPSSNTGTGNTTALDTRPPSSPFGQDGDNHKPPSSIPDTNPSPSPPPSSPKAIKALVGGVWTIVHNKSGSPQLESKDARFGPECSDCAIRATFKAKSKDWAYLVLRCSQEGSRYAFILKPTGHAEIVYWKSSGGKGEVLKEIEYDRDITLKEYTLLFQVVGKTLTGFLNGTELLSTEDGNISCGVYGISARGLDSFREVAILKIEPSIYAAPAPSLLNSDSRISLLETQFQQAYDRDVIHVHDNSVADLDAKYVAALERVEAAASNAGNPDELQKIKNEILRVKNKQPLPEKDTDLPPPSIRQLQSAYTDALAKIERDCKAKSGVMYDELDRQLNILERRLDTERRDDLVQLVRARRYQISEKKSRP